MLNVLKLVFTILIVKEIIHLNVKFCKEVW